MNKYSLYSNSIYLLIFVSVFLSNTTLLFSKYENFPFLLHSFQENRPPVMPRPRIVPEAPTFVERQRPQQQAQEESWIALSPNAITTQNLDDLRRIYPNLSTLIIDGPITVSDYYLLRNYSRYLTILISVRDNLIPLNEYFRSNRG